MGEFLLPPVRDWAEWGPIFTDAALWRPAVERVWALASWGEEPPRQIEAGFPGTCAVFVVDEAAVVKFFPPMVAGDFGKERGVYRLLADRVAEMPRLLADGVWRDRQSWPYLVTSFVPGQAWREVRDEVPGEARLAIGRALGGLLRRVHDTRPIPGYGWSPVDSWRRLVITQVEAASPALRAHTALPEATILAAERLLRGTNWFAVAPRPRLLHGDLTEDHVLVGHRDGQWRMTGLLDWADAEWGDPPYDWVALYFGFCGSDPALFRAVLSGYDPAGAGRTPDRLRLLAFTLLHRFGAPIIANTLPPERLRAVTGLDELAGQLFPGFDD